MGLCPNMGFTVVKFAQKMKDPSNMYYQAVSL